MKDHHRSWTQLLTVAKRKPENFFQIFFSGFLFATAKVASITAMIIFHLILHPAVHIYDFHAFIAKGTA